MRISLNNAALRKNFVLNHYGPFAEMSVLFSNRRDGHVKMIGMSLHNDVGCSIKSLIEK